MKHLAALLSLFALCQFAVGIKQPLTLMTPLEVPDLLPTENVTHGKIDLSLGAKTHLEKNASDTTDFSTGNTTDKSLTDTELEMVSASNNTNFNDTSINSTVAIILNQNKTQVVNVTTKFIKDVICNEISENFTECTFPKTAVSDIKMDTALNCILMPSTSNVSDSIANCSILPHSNNNTISKNILLNNSFLCNIVPSTIQENATSYITNCSVQYDNTINNGTNVQKIAAQNKFEEKPLNCTSDSEQGKNDQLIKCYLPQEWLTEEPKLINTSSTEMTKTLHNTSSIVSPITCIMLANNSNGKVDCIDQESNITLKCILPKEPRNKNVSDSDIQCFIPQDWLKETFNLTGSLDNDSNTSESEAIITNNTSNATITETTVSSTNMSQVLTNHTESSVVTETINSSSTDETEDLLKVISTEVSPNETSKIENITLKYNTSISGPQNTTLHAITVEISTQTPNITSAETGQAAPLAQHPLHDDQPIAAPVDNGSFLKPSESAAILAGVFIGIALLGYIGLLSWRKILEKRYTNRHLLLTEDDDIHYSQDMRHFEL